MFGMNVFHVSASGAIQGHHGPLVKNGRPAVCALTFSLNIFFSESTYRILMKFHRNVPAMVLFRISWKKFDSIKNCGCHGNKTEKNFENLENLVVRNHKG